MAAEEVEYPQGEDAPAQYGPVETPERHITGWQRSLRWVAWLTFLGLAIKNSQSVYFSGLEWLALAAAIGISIWCMAKPLGGPKYELTEPAHVRGAFVSRTSWGLVLFGAILTVGGVAATAAMVYDVSTGRATVRDVLHDIGIFIEGWIVEVFTGFTYDAHLEKTHAYALFLLLIPGVLLVWYNLIPFVKRGSEWRVDLDGSVSVQRGNMWIPLLEYEFGVVTADRTTFTFAPGPNGGQELVLPQLRVFSREYETRLKSTVSAEFFRQRLTGRGFKVEGSGKSFTARRT
jgi:hypothetical protein